MPLRLRYACNACHTVLDNPSMTSDSDERWTEALDSYNRFYELRDFEGLNECIKICSELLDQRVCRFIILSVFAYQNFNSPIPLAFED